MTYRLTELGKLRIVRDDGKELGGLIDVRIRAKLGPIERQEAAPVDALLVGRVRWLERTGLRQDSGLELPPSAVVAIEDDRIVVRAAKHTPARSTRKRR